MKWGGKKPKSYNVDVIKLEEMVELNPMTFPMVLDDTYYHIQFVIVLI